jgi:hypothetical protein
VKKLKEVEFKGEVLRVKKKLKDEMSRMFERR